MVAARGPTTIPRKLSLRPRALLVLERGDHDRPALQLLDLCPQGRRHVLDLHRCGGWLFDGADGSQVALWTSDADRESREHAHDFDEYVLVIAGGCTVRWADHITELGPGDELWIPKGTPQRMAVKAGTRTLHVFGGHRAERVSSR